MLINKGYADFIFEREVAIEVCIVYYACEYLGKNNVYFDTIMYILR